MITDTKSYKLARDDVDLSLSYFQTSTPPQPLQTPLLAGVGAALGVLLVMVVVIIVVIVIIVVVMRRRQALQQSAEGPAFMSTVYSGRWTM